MTGSPPVRRTYTVPEVAELAGVHVETVRKWIRTGRLERLALPVRPIRVSCEALIEAGLLPAEDE